MSYFDNIRKAIESRFNTYWTANSGGVVVQWENAPFTQPAGGEWVRVVIRHGKGFQASIGSSKIEKQPGIAIVTVVCAKDGGTARLNALSDIAADALRYWQGTNGGVTVAMEAPFVSQAPEEAEHYTQNVNVPFEAQQVV